MPIRRGAMCDSDVESRIVPMPGFFAIDNEGRHRMVHMAGPAMRWHAFTFVDKPSGKTEWYQMDKHSNNWGIPQDFHTFNAGVNVACCARAVQDEIDDRASNSDASSSSSSDTSENSKTQEKTAKKKANNPQKSKTKKGADQNKTAAGPSRRTKRT